MCEKRLTVEIKQTMCRDVLKRRRGAEKSKPERKEVSRPTAIVIVVQEEAGVNDEEIKKRKISVLR